MSSNPASKDHHIKTAGSEIVVTAPGKVILHGDHSVVYGKLALAASLDLRTKIKLSEIDQPDTLIIQSHDLNFIYKFDLQKIKTILVEHLPLLVDKKEYNWEHPDLLNHEELVHKIDHFLDTSNISFSSVFHISAAKAILYIYAGIIGSTSTELRPLMITSSTDLTTGAGMGSSASFSVCVAAAFVQHVKAQKSDKNVSRDSFKASYWEIDLDKFNEKELDLICQWSFCAEKIIHGTPSGLDNTTCTYGSIVEYKKGSHPKLLNISCSINLLLINTKVPRETRKLVSIAASLKTKFPVIINNILDAMDAVSIDALKNYKELSTATDEDAARIYENLCILYSINHSLLNSLGVGHSKLEEIVEILGEVGLKGKLTGAGGGGYAICLIPKNFDDTLLDKAVQKLYSRGFDVVRTGLGVEGVRLEKKIGDCLEQKF